MNIYLIGMCIAMALYIVIGIVISRKIRGAEDFYVAGRRAPVLLIAGSLIASYTSTGMFMGDAAQCYEGAFSSIIIFAGMQSAGYIIGAVFFGRYLRRSKAMTIPEFFGERFNSEKVRTLAAVTAVIMMTVYLLSVMQGIGTMMNIVTGVDYNICIIIALVVFAFISITSGSRGVLITDTLMAAIFTVSMIFGILFISKNAGGWFGSIASIASNPETREVLSWGGKPGPLYDTGAENVAWGLVYGVVWMSVCMAGPWQSSRYQMAKSEHVIVRSSFYSAIGVFLLEFLTGLAAVMILVVNPSLDPSSHVLIWGAMNMMPLWLGVIMLTGVLSAGISSATTFLSLIGTSAAYDVFKVKDEKKSINVGRVSMLVVGLVVLALAVFNPPSIFWIMFLGGAVAASAWMPVALASILSKRVTKTGAFCGMLFGFLGCFALKLYSSLSGVELPVYFDPSVVGIVCNVVAMTIGSALTKVTDEERNYRAKLFIMPESEKDPAECRKTLRSTKRSLGIGLLIFLILLILWIVPYYMGL